MDGGDGEMKSNALPQGKAFPTIHWGEPRCQIEHEGEHGVPQAERPLSLRVRKGFLEKTLEA